MYKFIVLASPFVIIKSMRLLLVAVSLCGCFSSIHAEPKKEFKIPSYVNVCYRDDPKVAECLKKEIETLLPIFKNGTEEFNLESLDPMYFDVLPFDYKSGIVGGKLNMTDVYIHGLSACKVIDVRPELDDPKLFKLHFDVHLPFMNLKGNYHLKGNIIKIPVDIKGRIDMLFEGLNITYQVNGDIKTIDENEYLILDRFTWKFFEDGVHKAKIQNKDVVYGKPALNQLVRTVVNSNWKPLIMQMLPVITPESDKKLKSIFSKFFKTFPYDVLFPKMPKDDKNEDKDKDKIDDKDKDKNDDKDKNKDKDEHKKEDTDKDDDKKDNDKKQDMDKDNDKKQDMNKDKDKKQDMNKDKDKKEDMNMDKDKKEDMNMDKDKKEDMNMDKDKKEDMNMDKDKEEDMNMDKDKKEKEKTEDMNKDKNKIEDMKQDKDKKEDKISA